MGNQGRQGDFSNNYSQCWKKNQNQNFGWKQDYSSSNKQGPFQQQHKSNYASMPERMSKVEDALTKIVSTQENSMATNRSMEIQMGQMGKQIAQIAEGQIGQFSANTTINPEEHCNKITTESDKNKIRERDGEIVKVEEEKVENRKKKGRKI